MARHDAGAADEQLAQHRGDDDSGIFLRHAQGITGDIFIDNQVADHRHPQTWNLGQKRLDVFQAEIVPLGEIERLDDGRDVELAELPPHQVQRGKTPLRGTENQPPAIAVQHGLFGVAVASCSLPLTTTAGLSAATKASGASCSRKAWLTIPMARMPSRRSGAGTMAGLPGWLLTPTTRKSPQSAANFSNRRCPGCTILKFPETKTMFRPGATKPWICCNAAWDSGCTAGLQQSDGLISISGRRDRRCSRSSSASLIWSSVYRLVIMFSSGSRPDR